MCLKPIRLFDDDKGGGIRCLQCCRRCLIATGNTGFCGTVYNDKGTLYTLIYGLVASSAVDPIEKKPVYHYKPGSECFSVGSLGCNFRCKFCQNWQISYSKPSKNDHEELRYMSPEAFVRYAIRSKCSGVAWTYNEPSIWAEYTIDCAKLCKESGLYTVYVTNGYATTEHLDAIGPYLDVYRVDIKSLSSEFYRKLAGAADVDSILNGTIHIKQKWNAHVECVTNVIPGWNDSDNDLKGIATWIVDNLGSNTPWHVTRFFPNAQMQNVPITPESTIINAINIEKETGIKYVYAGNINLPDGGNTYCPKCGNLCIERKGYYTNILSLNNNGCCPNDNEALNVIL